MYRKRCLFSALVVVLIASFAATSSAAGLLVPTDRSVRPLSITHHRVDVEINNQAAVTTVKQAFLNHTSRQLEAYYLFPVPEGANVRDFVMWVNGKKERAELVEAKKARQIYESIVRQSKDPGLLEHMGNNLFRVRVFPIAPRGEQKIEISYSQVCKRDAGVAHYIYPLKTSHKSLDTKTDFAVKVELNSDAALKSVYSPSHDVDVSRKGDHRAIVGLEESRYALNKDFDLFWTVSEKDVGLSMLTFRRDEDSDGYFMLMVSPKVEAVKNERVPRDLIFVVDTSGSMKGEKIKQARNALKHCVKSLAKVDRFNLVSFSTTTHQFADELRRVKESTVDQAVEWIDDLEASGGTAIDEALKAALDMRTDDSRNFTVVFLTDGLPTIGETAPKVILHHVKKQSSQRTRIFCFGVGDDVNTHLLDQLSDTTRATTVYVRPKENIETKVSSFYDKISHPVLADLELKLAQKDVRFRDVYPPELPDLFHGSQLVVFGRYKGSGANAVKLTGKVGDQKRSFTYDVQFPERKRKHDFLPGLWARRKVGYLLDHIRLNGEKRELVDEVVQLAKKYGIVTPYTSYLVAPDERPAVALRGRVSRFDAGAYYGESEVRRRLSESLEENGAKQRGIIWTQPKAEAEPAEAASPAPAERPTNRPARSGDRSRPAGDDSADKDALAVKNRALGRKPADGRGGLGGGGGFAGRASGRGGFSGAGGLGGSAGRLGDAEMAAEMFAGDEAKLRLNFGVQSGKQAVDLAKTVSELKSMEGRAKESAARKTIDGKTFLNINGIWVDVSFKQGAEIVKLKYLSDAYFRFIELAPTSKSILALGEQIVWTTPSGKVLYIGPDGKEEFTDDEIKALMTAPAK